eukprot:7277307-Ditylum_brightwellii.AAC.1
MEAMRSAPKVALYCTIESAVKLGDIKFIEQVLAFLYTYKIFMDYNHFETEEKGSPGYLMEINPKLTNKINLGYTTIKKSNKQGRKFYKNSQNLYSKTMKTHRRNNSIYQK